MSCMVKELQVRNYRGSHSAPKSRIVLSNTVIPGGFAYTAQQKVAQHNSFTSISHLEAQEEELFQEGKGSFGAPSVWDFYLHQPLREAVGSSSSMAVKRMMVMQDLTEQWNKVAVPLLQWQSNNRIEIKVAE